MFFGDFLVSVGLVTQEALESALAHQASANRRLGELAVARGWLTVDQVVQIRRGQQRDERLFGELAQALGMLEARQVDELRNEQQQGHVRIGEALVELGALTVDELAETLREFAVYQQQASRSVERAIAGTPHPAALTALISATRLMLPRCGLQGCAVVELRIAPHATEGVDWTAFMTLAGPYTIAFGMGMSTSAMASLAGSMGHRFDPARPAEALVYLGEFTRFVADRAQTELDSLQLEPGQVQAEAGDGYRWFEPLIAERDFTQVRMALSVPGAPTATGLLTVATTR